MRELNSEDASASVDNDGLITSATYMLAHMFGHKQSDMEGMPVELLVAEVDRDDLWSAMTAAVEFGEVDRVFDGWNTAQSVGFPVALQIRPDTDVCGVVISFTRCGGSGAISSIPPWLPAPGPQLLWLRAGTHAGRGLLSPPRSLTSTGVVMCDDKGNIHACNEVVPRMFGARSLRRLSSHTSDST